MTVYYEYPVRVVDHEGASLEDAYVVIDGWDIMRTRQSTKTGYTDHNGNLTIVGMKDVDFVYSTITITLEDYVDVMFDPGLGVGGINFEPPKIYMFPDLWEINGKLDNPPPPPPPPPPPVAFMAHATTEKS